VTLPWRSDTDAVVRATRHVPRAMNVIETTTATFTRVRRCGGDAPAGARIETTARDNGERGAWRTRFLMPRGAPVGGLHVEGL